MVGPNGERWVPVHTLVPHSRAAETMTAVRNLFDEHETLMEEHGIGYGFLFATVAATGFVIEPVFFTPDALNELHEQTVEPAVLKKMRGFAANPAAAEATALLRGKVIDLFRDAGGIHMQIGKSYPYRQGLRESSFALVAALKKVVDPGCRVNPGALGLEPD